MFKSIALPFVLALILITNSLSCIAQAMPSPTQAERTPGPPSAQQSMHCSVSAENTTLYPHANKTKGLAYGLFVGLIAGIATSGFGAFFGVTAAGVGIGAGVDHVKYKNDRDGNYKKCINNNDAAMPPANEIPVAQ